MKYNNISNTDRRGTPAAAPLVLGIVGQIVQIMLLRELLMVFHGNELSIGIILSCWMIWVGAGSGLGAILIERFNRSSLLLHFSVVGVFVCLPATVLVIRLLRGFFDVLPGAYLSFMDTAVSCFLLPAPVCLLLGVQFVAFARTWRERTRRRDGAAAAKTYIMEALGAIIGGLLFTLILVHVLNAFQTAFVAGILMLFTVLCLSPAQPQGNTATIKSLRAVMWTLMFAALAGFPFLGRLDAWAYAVQWRLFAPEHHLIETHQSRYGTISVVRRQDQYSFYQSGHLAFSVAGPEAAAPALEEQEGAHFAHFALVQHVRPERILLIGGGLRGTLREILRHPVAHVDYIELDPVLTEAARRHVSETTRAALDSPRVRLVHTDGRLFVKTTAHRYDMVIVDVPDPITAVLNRYYTVEFFREAQARLASDGVLVIGVTSAADLRGAAIANRNAAIYHSLRQIFEHVLPAGERFLHFFATNAPQQISSEAHVLRTRYRERDIETEGFSEAHYERLLQEGPLRRINWILRNHGRSPNAHLGPPETGPLFPPDISEQAHRENELPRVENRFFINADFRPVGYYHTLVYWHALTRARRPGALNWVMHVQYWWVLPVIGVFLMTGLFLSAIRACTGKVVDRHYAVLLAVFTTGVSTMALQVALLFAFQSIYGFVYEMVGVIVAMFMAGLALGTTLTHRYIRVKDNPRLLACIQLMIAVFAGGIAVALPLSAAATSSTVVFVLFSLMTFSAGLFNGADFPLAMGCSLSLTGRPEKSTGLVYGVELFGACCGAALAGVVIAPILGIVACCLLASVMNVVAFLALILSCMGADCHANRPVQ